MLDYEKIFLVLPLNSHSLLKKIKKIPMKKIYYLLIALLITNAGFAQSQRMVLAEEFTQASCPPCAAQNPVFNTLLNANLTKVVSLKYQTNWPGVDPMNVQTQTWVAPRVTYYGINGVPGTEMDGDTMALRTGGYYTGAPHNWSQAKINTQYAVPSPFTVALSHTFDPTFSNVTVTMVITCTQAVTGTLYARVALVEKEIPFCTAPGTNGETDFSGVMRKMLPNATGTALPSTWIVGQTQTVTLTSVIPTYIYDLNQFGVVAFIQDDATQNVQQAAISEPQPLANDASLKSCTVQGPAVVCGSSFNIGSIDLTNTGTATLTSADISYNLDGGTPATYNWTGSLASGATASITIPTLTLATGGSHVFNASVTTANGATDYNIGNNPFSWRFIASLSASMPPITESFATGTTLPSTFGVSNPDGGPTWTRATQGMGGTNGSAKMDYYNSGVANIDDMILPAIDLSTTASADLAFRISKATYTGQIDQLDIVYSLDCGATWTSLWTKSDPTLATQPATTAGYTPSTSSTWRQEVISLSTLLGNSNVLLAFRAISGYGNNAYIDNINLDLTAGIGENAISNLVSLYPSPSAGIVNINVEKVTSAKMDVTVTNVLGKVVKQMTFDKSEGNSIAIDLSNQASGNYLVKIVADKETILKRAVIQK